MAVDPALVERDMYVTTLRDHDERVALGGWVYYVRGVKRKTELLKESTRGSIGLLDLILVPLFLAGLELWSRKHPWKVAVVRLGDVATWNDLTPRIVHLETLPDGVGPEARIAELVQDVEAGRFRPE